jgi:hypothetical protein
MTLQTKISKKKYYCFFCQEEIKRPPSKIKNLDKPFCSRWCFARSKNSDENIMQGNTGILVREYSAIHQWITKRYGKATKCDHCHIVGSKYEWALRKGLPYKKEINHFVQLCVSCHKKYDETDQRRYKISKALKGRPSHCPSKRIKVKKGGCEQIFKSITEASEKLGVSRTAIQNVLAGISKTTGGYICQYQ